MAGITDLQQLETTKFSTKAIADMLSGVQTGTEMCVCYACSKLRPKHREAQGRKFCADCDDWIG